MITYEKQKKIFLRLIISFICIIGIVTLIIANRDLSSNLNIMIITISVVSFFALLSWSITEKEETYFQITDFYMLFFTACFAFQLFFTFGYFKANVNGSSMIPTLSNGQNLIVRTTNDVDFQDVVVLVVKEKRNNLSGINDGELIVKRVIGLPGDEVYCQNNILYINGNPLLEEYLEIGEYTNNFNLKTVVLNSVDILDKDITVIPEDYYLVLGDNRNESNDSRYLGLFHKSQILGKVKYKMLDTIFEWEKVE